MRSYPPVVALVVLLVAALCSSTAFAERPAKPRELAAIAKAGHEPAKCITAEISTVNPNYATVGFPHRPHCIAANFGVVVVKRTLRNWKVIFSASCCFRCNNVPAPLPVKRDLKIPTCVATKARRSSTETPVFFDSHTVLADPIASNARFGRRPAALTIYPHDEWELFQIHWETWSPTAATATGASWVNTCEPNCAAAHITRRQAHLTLSDP